MFPKTIIQKTLHIILALSILASLNIGLVDTAHAQEIAGDKIAFSQIYKGTRILRGPQDSTSMGFRVPAHWAAPTGGQLDLNFTMLLFGSGFADTTNPYFKAIVNISLNNIQIGSAIVDKEGFQTVSFQIPVTAWQAVKADGINDITIQLITNDQCGGASIMTIDSSSLLTIPHETMLPVTDLHALPWPFYQNTFYPDAAVLVLPDDPTPGDLKAALTVSAGFGRFTDGALQLTSTTASALTEAIEKKSNLIFIGKPGAFKTLGAISWPNQPAGIAPDDGLLQMVVSPWNPEKVVLWVSGTSDAGIAKAGAAFSSGEIRTGTDPNIAVVTETHNIPTPDEAVVDTTVSKLGYTEEYRQGEGGHSIDYLFTLPYGQSANGDGYIKLIYANSALLDFARSGFTVTVNGQSIGSGRFTERSTNVDTITIVIPQGTILPGQNRITILESLRFPDACARPLDGDLWAVVRPDTMIHIPVGPAPAVVDALNLRSYPEIFSPTLDTLAFILAPSDPLGWSIAVDVAYDLGQKTQGTLINPEVAFAGDTPQKLREERSLLLIGIPSKLPILTELTNLPATFAKGSDTASEPQNELKFRLSADTPTGYLEICQSLWNPDRLILTVLGNNTQGLLSARKALLTPTLRSKLTGNLAVVYGNNIFASNTNRNATPQPVTIIVPPTATPTPSGTSSNGLSQSNLILIGIIAVVVFIFAAVFILLQRRRTPPKQ